VRLWVTLVDRGVGDRVPVQVRADSGAPVAVLAAPAQIYLQAAAEAALA
jgi:hypothetical protein